MERRAGIASLVVMMWLTMAGVAGAHHVLGRPAYSLNEDSNTPPSMQAEVQAGDYFVTYMAFPAFPRPGKPGRISLYVRRIDDGTPFQGKVAFKVRNSSWLSWLGIGNESHKLGLRPPDDNVFRQGFLFEKAGDYIITAEFEAGDEPYVIDFPLRIGEPPPVGPIGIAVGALVIVLLAVNIVQRRRSMTGKIRGAHEGKGKA
ncbi:MAG: hypothetical protein V3T02_10635 [Alphaproteobacteria bacterium]